ncbi:glycosyltransferase [Salinibacterium sp. G-O1]|uniref:glycosyltransferase n=1 Tax=Salinibacterium sp. G-O1 TaxID=3046208 RepID=UPI0024B8F598|nr:glycosyltransferase [Salinibacterium sp. G-O1]MDJ0335875.1 glycosyltransferase [Salinibacterium sp. G-O1]
MGILTALDAVRQATRLVDAMRLAEELAFEASREGGVRTIRVLKSAIADDNQLVAIAAIHALAGIFDDDADRAISKLLSSKEGYLREHAAWALSSRVPQVGAVSRLIGLVIAGGFGGMVAQRTLEQWSNAAPENIAVGVEGALLGVRDEDARYRLVETLGLVGSSMTIAPLLRIAADESEHEIVRVAAVSALGQRGPDPRVVTYLEREAAADSYLADVARLSLVDVSASPSQATPTALTVAQLFLHADIDADLSQVGSGDNGGIATLLVRLGDALMTTPDASTRVERVITLSRGSAADAVASVSEIAAASGGHVYGRVPTLSEPIQSASAWPLRVAVRRGIRRLLRAAGGVDVLHLRMADVGSLAAADVARELDIPVVFTVAPDPHAVIDSLDKSGTLTQQNFGDVDEREHFWFRVRLVQRLAANADHTVLFPRPNLQRDMRELVGIDLTAHPERHSIVPEGIDMRVIDRAVDEAADLAAGLPATAPLQQLSDLLEALPESRRGLPLLVSVGRFHRVKGMAAIVEAWAGSALADRANLLLVGGDLQSPSADEQQQLEAMDAVVPAAERAEAGLVLSGHQPNDTAARWVAAARFGIPGLAAPRGVYVCGSLKEEFGIALLEAMASGLFVVAPAGGGPATYVQQHVTGLLVPTWDLERLQEAMVDALEIASTETDDERAALSRATVEDSFTIQAMAQSLAEVYSDVNQAQAVLGEWAVPTP